MGREIREHVGEVEVALRAPDLPGLFVEAGLALAEVMEPATAEGREERRRVAVRGRDREALLVAFVDELIYRTEMDGRVWTRIAVDRIDGTSLSATIAGPPVTRVAVPVKAASLHGLAIRETASGVEATLVLDV